jgi:hypothetical protein
VYPALEKRTREMIRRPCPVKHGFSFGIMSSCSSERQNIPHVLKMTSISDKSKDAMFCSLTVCGKRSVIAAISASAQPVDIIDQFWLLPKKAALILFISRPFKRYCMIVSTLKINSSFVVASGL